ncbi:MAG: HEAT repeat domain-containing protein [Verrucomicrobia bacterium]|nr:HEAT repeat domain-containing protein [Verrucomicrobiota bacterium]
MNLEPTIRSTRSTGATGSTRPIPRAMNVFGFIRAGLGRQAVALASALLFVAGCLVPNAVWAAEPSGPDIAKLLSDLTSGDKAVRRDASYKISQQRPPDREAVPALIEALDDQDDQVWFNSITALARIGPDAGDAVPALITQLEKSSTSRYSLQVWYRAAFALGSIGQPAFPALSEALAHQKPFVRSGAAKALQWVGPKADSFVPLLIHALGDEDPNVREQAAISLGAIGGPAHQPVLHTLASDRPVVRQAAALALQWLGISGEAEFTVLLDAEERETDADTRAVFLRTLSKLHCASPRFVARLVLHLEHDSETVRNEVANAFILMEPPESTSVPALGLLVENDGANIRKEAAFLLGRIGPSAAPVIPQLIKLRSSDTDAETATAVETALVQIGNAAVPALLEVVAASFASKQPSSWAADCLRALGTETVPALIGMLRSGDSDSRKAALALLKQVGTGAEAALPELQLAAKSSDSKERSLAIEAMAIIPAPAQDLFPIAEAALTADDLSVRRAGAIGMVALQKAARPALPLIIRALEDEDAIVASNAARAIGLMGPAAELAFEPLQNRLQNGPLPVRLEVVRALGMMGEVSKPVLPDLLQILAEGPKELQTAVSESLGNLGTAGREALPELRNILDLGTPSARFAALDAYLRLEQDARETFPVLTNRLADSDTAVRHLALDSLGDLGRRAQPAEPHLFGLLNSPEDRTQALGVLRSIRTSDVELLTGALTNEDWLVRQFAADRLSQLGARSTSAIPELQKLRDDKEDSVRRAARAAVQNIQEAARKKP